MSSKKPTKSPGLSKSQSKEVLLDWDKLKELKGAKVSKARPKDVQTKDTKPKDAKAKDGEMSKKKTKGWFFNKKSPKDDKKPKDAKGSPKDDTKAKDADSSDKDKKKMKKSSSSSSSDDSSTWGGFRITTIKIDKWKEYTRDQPMFIASSRYLCGDIIGEGSQAKVFEALDTWTLRRRVVKRIIKRKELGYGEEKEMNAILMECNIIRKMNHENIIKIFDVFLKSDSNYFELNIVKEYCACTVTEILDSKPKKRLPIWQAHLYFIQLIAGLDCLHSRGIIHHDIKPDNLLINNDNCLKIIDFGISHEKDTFDGNMLTGSSHGTKLYFAPEKFYGLINLDRYEGDKSDLYAAGVTLHVLACGKHPFFDDDHSATAETKLKNAIKEGKYQYSSVQADNPGMFRLIKSMLAFHPKDRLKIEGVKHDPWFKMTFNYQDLADIPPRDEFGDRYRTMSMTPYLHQLHYPLSEKERAVVVRSDSAADLVQRKKRVPYVRANRLPTPTRSPPDDLNDGNVKSKSKSPPPLWPQY